MSPRQCHRVQALIRNENDLDDYRPNLGQLGLRRLLKNSDEPPLRTVTGRFSLFRRRTVWLPTLLGWICLLFLFGGLGVLWWVNAESLLSPTERLPAEVLVVEGWIGKQGVLAGGEEFRRGGYRYAITTGGTVGERWNEPGWTYAETARRELIAAGLPKDEVLAARPLETANARTFQAAAAAWRTLDAAGIRPQAVDVFTLGPHARRSRLVFAKIFGGQARVGVVAWEPAEYTEVPWWRSSERVRETFAETGAYLFEALLNSGRLSNDPHAGGAANPAR
jgi:hypothetical protein